MSVRCLVVGCGSIGLRHIRNLRTLGVTAVAACDPVEAQLDAAVAESEVEACPTIEDGLADGPALTLVCTPPHLHVSSARQAVAAGSHVFIEKPLSHTLEGVDALLSEAAARNLLVYVGYNWRFHPGLMRVHRLIKDGAVGRVLSMSAEFGQYLPDWRPTQDYRRSYSAQAAQGGGIILDSSHELDYVRWFAGEVVAVSCVAGRLSAIEMDAEDTAEILLGLDGGGVAQVHLDCTQRAYTRTCKVRGSDGTIAWDHLVGVRYRTASSREWREEAMTVDLNGTYLRQVEHVLACVRDEAAPLVDGATGRRVLEIALAAKRSAALRQEVSV